LQMSQQSSVAKRQLVEIEIKLNHPTRERIYVAHSVRLGLVSVWHQIPRIGLESVILPGRP
jgi:hypothetical protein